MRWRVVVAGTLLLACVFQSGDGATKRIEILRAPHFLTDDTPVAFQLRILPDAANRRFTITAVDDVGEVARSSGEDLPGPTTRLIEWNSLSAGDYELIAVVFGADGRILARDSSHLTVLAWRGP